MPVSVLMTYNGVMASGVLALLSEVFLNRSRMGLITLGSDRSIDACFGKLVSQLTVGERADHAIPFLIGLDDVLNDVANGARASFSLPRMACDEGPLADKVVSLEVLPSEPAGGLQILVRDESEFAGLERTVLQQRNELSLANEDLSEAKKRIEAALEEKSSFLAKISHDLKTPLQVIMGNAEILRGDLAKDEREAFLQDVLDNGSFLLALINDLLDASALDAEQMKLAEEVVDVGAMLEQVLFTVRQLPGGSKRRFELNIDDERRIFVDPMRLRRLLLNLIGNAVKFTSDGGRISLNVVSGISGDLVIEIEDDGCGMGPEIMERVFEPFAAGRSAEGSGLGLHIAKGIADLHEADLTLVSEPGAGTTARLCLPKSRMVVSQT